MSKIPSGSGPCPLNRRHKFHRRSRTHSRALHKSPHIPQNFPHHPRRQFPRERILLARMIRSKKPRQLPRQLITGPMPKRIRRESRNLAAILQQPQIRPHRYISQHQHRPRPQDLELPLEISLAIRRLSRQRFIPRRRAPHRRSHICILQLQPIAALLRRRLIRKPGPIQRRVQEIPRPIPRKHPPRPVSPVRRRRQSQNKQLRSRIPESRHRLSPVLAPAKRQPLLPRYPLAIFHQPRTPPAPHNLLIQLNESTDFRRLGSFHRRPRKTLPRNCRFSAYIQTTVIASRKFLTPIEICTSPRTLLPSFWAEFRQRSKRNMDTGTLFGGRGSLPTDEHESISQGAPSGPARAQVPLVTRHSPLTCPPWRVTAFLIYGAAIRTPRKSLKT
jgi:hypothetical protein